MKKVYVDGYANVPENVAQFGEEMVEVRNGRNVVFYGRACDFDASNYRYTLCADVRKEDGKNVVLF